MSTLHRVRSQYSSPSRESGRSYSPAPARLSQRAEPPSPFGDFPDEEYRKAGSMWTWATIPEETFFCDDGQPDREVDKMRGIEAWKWKDEDIENQTEIRELVVEEDVRGWLKEEVPEVDGERPCAGMRIIQINQQFRDEMPLTSRTFEAILNDFTLPPVELHQSSVKQGAIVFLEEDDGSYVLVHRRTHIKDLTSVVIRYDPETNFTTGYILTNLHEDRNLDYLQQIPNQFLGCCHPFLLPIIFIEADFENGMVLIKEFFDDLKDIERQTGFTNYAGSEPTVGSRGRSTKNYQTLIRQLGELHTLYLNNQVSLFSWQKCLKYIQEKLPVLYEQLPDKNQRALKRPSIKLNSRMEFLSSSLDHAVIFGNFQTRLQAQQSVLLNLITQQDSQVNLAVARESKEVAVASKQDSSAMKIIAFLTTIFLPGTFVATLFSMPFFNWNADSVSRAANSNFWIYWAVTGPLTLATMFVVIVWAMRRYKKTEKLRQEARESPVLGNNNYSESNFYFEKGKNGSRILVDPGEEEKMAEKTKQAFVMPNFMKRRREDSYNYGRSNGKNNFKTRRLSPLGKKAVLGRGGGLARRETFDSIEIGRGPPFVRRGTQFSAMSERGVEKQSTFNTVDVP